MTDPSLPKKNDKIKTPDVELVEQLRQIQDTKKELVATLEMYSGPIPHPDILGKYESIFPGAAKAIIENGIEESNHRRKLEDDRQKRRGHLAWLTLIALLLLSLTFIAASFVLILYNHKIIGSIFGGGGFLALLGNLLTLVSSLSSNDDIATSSKHEKNDK
ncbi:MAG: DUF2335 domain-containing protein [Sporolactobacillus sp.]